MTGLRALVPSGIAVVVMLSATVLAYLLRGPGWVFVAWVVGIVGVVALIRASRQ